MAGTRTELQMIKMSEIQSQEVAWLWFPFIPYGKLTIVQGDPGDGKTTLVLNIAAKLSKRRGSGQQNETDGAAECDLPECGGRACRYG